METRFFRDGVRGRETFRAAISRHGKPIDEVVREQRIGETPRTVKTENSMNF
jgi:hypothetical protein